MKSNNQNIPYYLCLTVLFMIANMASAQNRNNKNTADSAVIKIAKKLSVSPEKAGQIHDAYAYKHEEITRLKRDSTFKGPGRAQLLKKLEAERKHKIDSTATPAQQAAMRADQVDLYKRQMEMRDQIIKRHEEEMNRIPHKRIMKSTLPDTTKNKPKAKN